MNKGFLILSVILITGCYRDKNSPALSNEAFLHDVNDTILTTAQILDKYLPSILAQNQDNTSIYYYGYDKLDEDSIWRCVMAGKIIDKKHVVAIEVNLRDTTISFYQLNESKWSIIGREKTNIDIYNISLEDLDGDGDNEIVTSTSNNMNGNSWKEIYIYSHKANSIKYAGSFSTVYEVDVKKKQVQEMYTGSWYMDESKTLYEWRNEMLVPIKQIVFNKEHFQDKHSYIIYEYYENHADSLDGLKLLYSESYINTEKQDSIWDNFFEEGQ